MQCSIVKTDHDTVNIEFVFGKNKIQFYLADFLQQAEYDELTDFVNRKKTKFEISYNCDDGYSGYSMNSELFSISSTSFGDMFYIEGGSCEFEMNESFYDAFKHYLSFVRIWDGIL